jgi:hypothetical protein
LLVVGYWLLAGGNSGCEPDDFKFGGYIDSGEKLVDAKHRRVLQLGLTALAALKDGQCLQNHN